MLAVRGSSTQRTTLPQAARIAPTGPRANVRAALATSGSTALANANNPTTRRVRAAREPPLQCPLHGSIASDRRKACLCGRSPRARRPRHGIAVPLRRTEMPVVQAILRAAGGQCRGDPVGRPAGPWRAGSRDDAVPSCTIAPGRRTASPLHAPQDRPSPGAARRPLPARERRFFVASLGTAGSFLSAHSTDQTLPAGNVGATRWVAHAVRRVHWDRVGSCGADVHNGARATHRDAGVPVVGAVREPPLQHAHCTVRLRRTGGRPASAAAHPARRACGTAPPCPSTTRKRAWFIRSCAPPADVGATGLHRPVALERFAKAPKKRSRSTGRRRLGQFWSLATEFPHHRVGALH